MLFALFSVGRPEKLRQFDIDTEIDNKNNRRDFVVIMVNLLLDYGCHCRSNIDEKRFPF